LITCVNQVIPAESRIAAEFILAADGLYHIALEVNRQTALLLAMLTSRHLPTKWLALHWLLVKPMLKIAALAFGNMSVEEARVLLV
jgi:hypothetical protein